MGRRVVLDAPGRHRVETLPGPGAPGPGEVRVSVAAAGVCGSDRELYDGTRPAGYARYPLTPGHEWSGTVAAVGAGVDPALVGRKTVGEGFRTCQLCERCRGGQTSLCSAGYDETGFTQPGAFADHLVLPARLLHLLPDAADLRAAALLEPAAVVAAAALAARARPGESVAVLGCGTLGLLAVQLLAASSPAELTAVDPRPEALARAAAFGATATAAPDDGPGGRCDLVVETAGAPRSAADAVRYARRGGRIVLTGIPGPGAQGLDPAGLVVRALTTHTVFGASPAAWAYAVRAFTSGLLNPEPLITHDLPLERYADAVALVGGADPRAGKVLLHP
ncbi:alcohol dehydrogenase catalytic domain-containing protein [Streptomyces sp. TRM 70351]|uniref:zinc-dependent alcohol dehydrogenase n=1 Tax=Streptomyces sp. TRM 70351 TaxID=3116552 RepID=UPI002E7AF055|nr:alcohol dehydrogenase catalytic domain-containing protein [Streptomyces sp. TRM 70351]MEE1930787.1 alcohol dehydrogenase catalytic domain-containing protein [Streptomyces sp. TRM 70351]